MSKQYEFSQNKEMGIKTNVQQNFNRRPQNHGFGGPQNYVRPPHDVRLREPQNNLQYTADKYWN